MATIYQMLIVAQDDVTGNIQNDLYAENNLKERAGVKIVDYFQKVCSGSRAGVVQTKIGAVKAAGTVTLVSQVATNTVTINGVVLTAVASGATTDQYNVGGGDTTAAASLASAINANTTLDGMVVATSSLGVVTVTALVPGELGNAITLAISANGSVSAARMAGGTNGDTETTHYFGSGA
jgi:hypothetical protein